MTVALVVTLDFVDAGMCTTWTAVAVQTPPAVAARLHCARLPSAITQEQRVRAGSSAVLVPGRCRPGHEFCDGAQPSLPAVLALRAWRDSEAFLRATRLESLRKVRSACRPR